MSKRLAQKQATHARLVAAARALFREEGFEATTLARVAAQASMAVGTVCLHFPTKGALIQAAFHEELEGHIRAGMQDPPADPVHGLLHRIAPLYAFYAQDRALSRALLRETLFQDGADTVFAAQINGFQQVCAAHLRAAQQRGALPGLDTNLAAAGFFADYLYCLMQLIHGLSVEASTAQLEALTRQRLRHWEPS